MGRREERLGKILGVVVTQNALVPLVEAQNSHIVGRAPRSLLRPAVTIRREVDKPTATAMAPIGSSSVRQAALSNLVVIIGEEAGILGLLTVSRNPLRHGGFSYSRSERKPLGEDKPAKTGGAKGSRRRSGPHSQQKGPPPTREGNTSSTRQEQGSPPRRKRKETARVPPFPKDFPFDPFPFFSGSGTPSPFDGFGRYRNSRARGEYGTRNPKGPRRGNRNDDWTGNIYDSCEDSYEQVSLPDGQWPSKILLLFFSDINLLEKY